MCNWFWKLGLVGGLSVVLQAPVLTVSERANAQITPDSTLAAESSVIVPNVVIDNLPSERVDGGAIRGANLFHSFQEFNVGEGRGVYFSNPSAVENIFSRVTGANSSNILGRLGVLGNANLYLMNPNGIVFGQNASLDVEGSFVATTANAIKFGNTGIFSATQPQQSSLLSVSPGALFFNQAASQPGNIINRGNLSAPKDLTLAGGNLDLQGQFYAGGNLSLQATDTVKIRDSVASPFLASSGGNLAILGNQGIDILALNHPTQTSFVSRGNLNLISDGIISGDARFSSGGSFSIHNLSGGLANFVSKYDPIISSNGDVDIAADYTGASLLVESKGNIRFRGGINITTPDTSALPAGQDTATLSNSTALIMRSGQNTLAYGGVNNGSVPAFTSGTVPEGITLGGDVSLQRFNGTAGLVSLTAASGDVNTKGITTNGGRIDINSAGAITTTGILNSSYSPLDSEGNGGAITFTAGGNITTGILDSEAEGTGNGGDITLTSNAGAIDTTLGFITSEIREGSNGTGRGGKIVFTAKNNIQTAELDASAEKGDGNNIQLTSSNGAIDTTKGTLYTESRTGNAGTVFLEAFNNITTSRIISETEGTGNGGNITLTSNAGAIDTTLGFITSEIREGSNGTGRGGKIVFTAKDNIQTAELDASAETGNGNNIQLTSSNGAIDTTKGTLYTESRTGNAGTVFLEAFNNITTSRIISNNNSSNKLARGGDITLISKNGEVRIDGEISTNTFGSSKGGDINITTGSLSLIGGARLSASTFGQGDAGNVFVKATDIILDNANNNGLPTSILANVEEGAKGNAGNINITTGNLSVTNGALIESRTRGTGNGGQIIIDAKGKISFDGSRGIYNSGVYTAVEANAEGNGGDIEIKTGALSVKDKGQILARTSGQGSAGSVKITASDTVTIAGFDGYRGATVASDVVNKSNGNGNNVEITARKVNFQNNAIVAASILNGTGKNGSKAQAGNVNITAHEEFNSNNSSIFSNVGSTSFANGGTISITAPKIFLDNQSRLITGVQSGGIGNAGNVEINTGSLFMRDGARINAGTSGSGDGGKVNINAEEEIVLDSANNNGLPTSILGNVEVGAKGNAGDIKITTGNLSVTNGALIESRTRGTGNGGQIIIDAKGKISFDGSRGNFNSGVYTAVEANAEGNGGDIEIKTGALSIKDRGEILARTSGQGSAGSVKITASDTVTIAGFNGNQAATVASDVVNKSNGNGNNVEITARKVNLQNNAIVAASILDGTGKNGSKAQAGNVNITASEEFNSNNSFIFSHVSPTSFANGGTISITAPKVTLAGNARLFTYTSGEGNAGSVIINAHDTVTFDRSSAFNAVTSGGKGDGGNIKIKTGSLSLINGAQVISNVEPNSKGSVGNIEIEAKSVTLLTGSELGVRVRGDNQSENNQRGSITIKSENLTLGSNALIQGDVDITGKGQGADINLIVTDAITLIGGETAPTGESTRIALGVLPNGVGSGGNLYIKAGSLILQDGAIVKASAQGAAQALANAGSITIEANVVDISGSVPKSGLPGGIFSSTDTSGKAGDIIVNADKFRIADGAILSARTRGDGTAGNIRVNTGSFEAINGGQLITTTSGKKQAGNIFVGAKDEVLVSGSELNYNTRIQKINPFRQNSNSLVANDIQNGANSGLFVSTSGEGKGGDVTVRSNKLTLKNSEISALTEGKGNAGNININVTGLFSATDSDIITSATQSSGGVIDVKAGDIRLFGDSDIKTNIGSGAGGGGNITLTANSIIAFGDSDILAFARDGRGGNISLKTPAFFGQNYKAAPFGIDPSTLDGNNRVDINASGAVSGVISLPDTSFIQNSLSELPENVIDTRNLIANSCITRANNQQQGTFIIKGSGALPSRPGDALMSQYTFGSVRTNNASASNRRPWQKGDPIIEPQGAYRLHKGRLVLSRECD